MRDVSTGHSRDTFYRQERAQRTYMPSFRHVHHNDEGNEEQLVNEMRASIEKEKDDKQRKVKSRRSSMFRKLQNLNH